MSIFGESFWQDPYFFWSFLPLSFLGVGFWFLFFERNTDEKKSLWVFCIALLSGIISAILATKFLGFFSPHYGTTMTLNFWRNFFTIIFTEEIFKVLSAITIMEIFRQKFQSIGGGILFGFSVGMGFALIENILYLKQFHEIYEFSAEFWLGFQGRFWSSLLIHGVCTGFFGLFYAGAYLSKTLLKVKNESPLTVLLVPFSPKNIWKTLTLNASRNHLLFHHTSCFADITSREIILEGLYLALIIHTIFNLLLTFQLVVPSIFLALFGMIFLRSTMDRLS